MAGAEPPYLPVGTDVSAKYRGAFCEAKVKKIVKSVKCKVTLKDMSGSVVVTDEFVKGPLKLGATVEIKHPETGDIVEGVISKLTDSSMYTVVFDDADERTLRRTQLCLKGEKHFIESETLDNLPLSHPEHFGTPVMQSNKEKKKRRSLRDPEDEESEVSSAESDMPVTKRANYKGKNRELVGKVMYIEVGDKKKMTAVPVLVALPDAHSTELRTKDHLLVRSFKDSKYLSVSRRELKEFVREVALKNEDKAMKSAMEKALLYYDSGEPPATWNKEELLGYETEVDEGADDDSSDDEPSEEKDRFVAQLYKFMDDRGTPINKAPSIGSKDLNLYKLFKVVQTIGGYNRVTNTMRWRLVYSKMNLPQSNSASAQIKNAYKKYLHAFEDFYRKLGSTMGTISRPGRSRHNSGRSLFRETQRKSDDIMLSPKERKTPVKEVKGKEGERRSKDTPERGRASAEPENDSRRQLDNVKKELSESFKSEPEEKSGEVREKRDLRETKERKGTQREEEERREDTKRDPSEEDRGLKATRKRARAAATAAASTANVTPGRKSPRVDEGKKEDEKDDDADVVKKEEKKDTRRKMKEKSKEKEDVKGKADEKEEVEESEEKADAEVDDGDVLPSATKLKVKYGRGRNQKIYEAKVVEASTEDGSLQYLVHYAGWNMRYDEWVKPDRIVKIVDKPDSGKKASKTKSSLAPQSPKGQQQQQQTPPVAVKKRGRPSSVTPTRPGGTDSKSHKSRSPAPTGSAKSRPTRSNSLEIPVMPLPSKARRTRRSSGYTESSDVQSHASESEESEMSFEEKSKEEECADLEETTVKVEPEEEEELQAPPPVHSLAPTPASKLFTSGETPKPTPEVKKETVLDKLDKTEDVPSQQDRDLLIQREAKKAEELRVKKGNNSGSASLKVEASSTAKEAVILSDSAHIGDGKKPPAETPTEKPAVVVVPKSPVQEKLESTVAEAQFTPDKPGKGKGPEEFVAEKIREEKSLELPDNRPDSGSDDESFSKVPVIVKEGDRKLTHAEMAEFEKPPTLVKAVSLTEMSTNQEKAEAKSRTRKPKENKKGRSSGFELPPVMPEPICESEPLVKERVPAATILKDKVPEKRPREGSAVQSVQEPLLEPQVKRERREEATEKVTEEKSDGMEIQTKDENEKKKVKKKMKKKHLEEKGEQEQQRQEIEGVKKDSTMKEKKAKDGSKKDSSKLGKSGKDKLSKKERKAKKKNKHRENEAEKVKDNSSSDLSNDSMRKLVAEVLSGKSEKCESVSPERMAPSSAPVSLPPAVATGATASSSSSSSSFLSSTSANPHTKDISATTSAAPQPSSAIPAPPRHPTPPREDPQPSVSSILMDNTPPTTPEHELGDAPEAPPDNLQLSIDRAVSRTMAEANLDAGSAERLPAGGESPSGGEGSTTSNESGSSGNMPSSESSNDMLLAASKRKRDTDNTTPSKKKKRASKRQEKIQMSKAAGSDSEETGTGEQKETIEEVTHSGPSPARAAPSRVEPRSPKPSKYNFNLEEGKYLEGEKRITFLVEKIAEIRKIYMSLKAEVACIDRRRKRHKRKERESESV